MLLAGGVCGSFAGVQAVRLLRQTGQIDLTISLGYVVMLGAVGALRGEQLRAMLALLVLAVAARMAVDLVAGPSDLFSLGP